MKNFLIILDNIEKTINQDVKSWLGEFDGQFRKNIKRVKHQKDFSFIVLEDTNTLGTIIENKKIKKVREENKDVSIYVILHKSALGNDRDVITKLFQDEFKTHHVIAESHFENEGFYHEKMPLLIQNTGATFSEIIDGYFSTDIEIKETDLINEKLTFLHNLIGDKLSNGLISEKLKEFNCSVSFNSDNKNASIIAIRNVILNS